MHMNSTFPTSDLESNLTRNDNLKIHPNCGTIAPKSSRIIIFSMIQNEKPSFFEEEITCMVTPVDELQRRLRMEMTSQSPQYSIAELSNSDKIQNQKLFLRIKKYTKLDVRLSETRGIEHC